MAPTDAAQLRACVDERVQQGRLPGHWRADGAVDVCAQTGSTNADLMQLAQETGARPPMRRVRVAHAQTQGRGRRGNTWIGAPGDTLMLSVGMQLDCQLSALSALPLVCGLAARDALASQGIAVWLKWPNDLLDAQGDKLGGLLIEAQSLATSPAQSWVVIGLGLNVGMPQATREALAARGVTDLARMGHAAFAPEVFIADWIACLEQRLPDMRAPTAAVQGRAPAWMSQFDACHALQGHEVRFTESGQVVAQGVFAGVTPEGAARVACADGRERVMHSGEASLRKAGPC